MPTSKKQIKANRENAPKSTGPKTEEGKQTISQNGVEHGPRYDLRLNRELSRSLKTLYRIQYHRKVQKTEGEKENSLKMSKQSQIPYNPKHDKPLWDIK